MIHPNAVEKRNRLRPVQDPRAVPFNTIEPVSRTSQTTAQAATAQAAAGQTVPPFVRWAFYLFVFSIPFETATFVFGLRDISLTRIFGYFLMVAALLHLSICFLRPPRAFWCFAAYLTVFLLLGLLQRDEYQRQIMQRFVQQAQMLLLFWIAWSLLHHETIARRMPYMLVVSCLCLAVMQKMGIVNVEVKTSFGDRVSALGERLNTMGCLMAVAFLAALAIAYEQAKDRGAMKRGGAPGRLLWRLVVWPCVALLGLSMVLTGSRGALVALSAGLMTFLLRESTWRGRSRNAIIIFLALGLCVRLSMRSEMAFKRWQATIEKGYYGRRDELVHATFQMFEEKPLFGWGPVRHLYVLGKRLNKGFTDTHNLYFWILTEVGLVGAIPFFAGMGLALQAAWRGRAGPRSILPLALMVCWLTMNLTATYHNRKLHWLILAYALTSPIALVVAPRAAASSLGSDGRRRLLEPSPQRRAQPVASPS